METPDDVDLSISCALPDPVDQPELHQFVTKFMLHGPCSERCQDAQKNCRKGHPMKFREETVLDDGRGWIGIKRCRGGPTFRKGGKTYDTRDVVPYSPILLRTMGCHINVLPFRNFKQARYLFKYITKGVDMACVEMTYQKFGHKIQVKFLSIVKENVIYKCYCLAESQFVDPRGQNPCGNAVKATAAWDNQCWSCSRTDRSATR